MKKTAVITVFMFCSFLLNAQPSGVMRVFDKYAQKDGYTTVEINANLFDLFCDNDSGSNENFLKKITNIKILTQDDYEDEVLNFYDEVMKDLPLSEYKELMVVKDSETELKMLVKEQNNVISEFLMVSGGKSDNVLIYIGGSFNKKDLAQLADEMDIEALETINEADLEWH